VWVADSFQGLPPPSHEADRAYGENWHTYGALSVSVDEVRASFARYGLLDEQVRFIEGWFAESLPGPIERLAVARLDGDMYESTWDALVALEPLVSPGGFLIIDDYELEPCARAVDEYRKERNISCPIEAVDEVAVFWRKAEHEAR
jgi:O-methyltransferase